MHSFTALLALAALAQAAPVAQKDAPTHYAEGYLEPYMTYHTRYIEVGCAGKQGTQFFTDCCSPMLATETLEDARLPYCRPNATETASYAASSTAAPVHQSASADYEAQSAYAQAITSESAAEASSTWTPEATTSTWSAKAEATTKAASSGGNVNTGGFATYFNQNGNPGACGNYHNDGEKGIAIDSAWWPNFSSPSEYCGKWITITNTNTGASTTAQVWDVCPTCTNSNSLDLSVGAFNAIASESEGMVPISWSFA